MITLLTLNKCEGEVNTAGVCVSGISVDDHVGELVSDALDEALS